MGVAFIDSWGADRRRNPEKPNFSQGKNFYQKRKNLGNSPRQVLIIDNNRNRDDFTFRNITWLPRGALRQALIVCRVNDDWVPGEVWVTERMRGRERKGIFANLMVYYIVLSRYKKMWYVTIAIEILNIIKKNIIRSEREEAKQREKERERVCWIERKWEWARSMRRRNLWVLPSCGGNHFSCLGTFEAAFRESGARYAHQVSFLLALTVEILYIGNNSDRSSRRKTVTSAVRALPRRIYREKEVKLEKNTKQNESA